MSEGRSVAGRDEMAVSRAFTHPQMNRLPRWLAPLAGVLLLAAGLLAALLAGVHVGAQGLRVPENPMPFPEPGSHLAPLTTSVGIAYDEAIDPATVNPATFAVHALQTGQLLEIYAVHSNTIYLTPTNALHAGELVQASATTGTLSAIDGTGPLTPTVWQFRTAVPFGGGDFLDSGQRLGDQLGRKVEFGDLDGDGDLDAFVVNRAGRPNKVWLNDGAGNFSDSGQALGSDNSLGMALGDIDGDGDLDVVAAGSVQSVVWLNLGNAVFTATQTLPDSNELALGDLNGDGMLDLFLARTEDELVFFNDGDGTFSGSDQIIPGYNTQNVALGDLDQDGDLDAVVINRDQVNRVWLNDGRGFFTDSQQNLGTASSYGVALGDLDGDGLLDVFIGNNFGQSNEVWFNQGEAQFVSSDQSLGNSSTHDVQLGDVDGDGDLDAFWANIGGDPSEVWLNTAGVFTDSGQQLGGGYEMYGVALGDVNGDGDLDAYLAIEPDPDYVWRNNRPVAAAGSVAPTTITEGGTVTLTGVISDPDTHDTFFVTVDWGDGNVETVEFPPGTTGFSVPHVYLDDAPSGTSVDDYLIEVEVRDGDGSSDEFSAEVTVQNVAPLLENVAISPAVLDEGGTATLSGEIMEPGVLDPLTLVVIWGDGTQENYPLPAGTTTFAVEHTYLDDDPSGTPADDYDLTLIIVDDDDGSSIESAAITVQNVSPAVEAGPDQRAAPGQPVSFAGAFSDPGLLDTHTILWDFGDGNVAAGTLTPGHSYSERGVYLVTLTIEDDDTGVGSDTLLVSVGAEIYLPIMQRQQPAASSASTLKAAIVM